MNRTAKPIHPTKLEVYPGQYPNKWLRNPAPAELMPDDFKRVFPGIESITTKAASLPKHIRGDTNPGNLDTLLQVAKWLGPATVLELGTFRGRTTLGFLENTNADIVTVDLPLGIQTKVPPFGPDLEYIRTCERPVLFNVNNSRIRQVFVDCTDSDALSASMRETFGATTIDFAYIDAAHTSEGVIVPFTTLLPMMTSGGIIAFDDYMKSTYADLTAAICRLSREGYVFYSIAFLNPNGHGTTSTVFFINDPLCKNRDWKNE